MSVRVTSNHAQVKSETVHGTALAVRMMIEDIHRKANPKTPKKHGNLRADVLKEVQGTTGKITWSKDYAIYQETKQFTNYTTPGTGPHFAEESVVEVVEDAENYFRKAGAYGR